MVIEHYLDEDGQITFRLEPTEGLRSLLPEEVAAELDSAENSATAEFYAYFDARTFGWEFSCVFHGAESAGKGDMELDPPYAMRKDLVSGINGWCGEELGESLVSLADRHLEESGISLSVKDCMERLGNLSFGETVPAARTLYTESYAFGNAVALEYNEFLPEVLERTGKILEENGLGKIFLPSAPMDAYAVSVDEDEHQELYERIEDQQDNLQRVSGAELEEMQGMDDDVQRYDAHYILSPRMKTVIVQFVGRDSGEITDAWIGIDEMRRVAREGEKPAESHQAARKLKM